MRSINSSTFLGACAELLHVAQIDNNRMNLYIICTVKTGVMFFTIHSQILLGTFQIFGDFSPF